MSLNSKILPTYWECPNREPHNCTLRCCKYKKKAYRHHYHIKNKERENKENKKRYHEKYKIDSQYQKKKKQYWKSYVKEKGPEWVLERSRKYRKPYKDLSPSIRSKIRENYKTWSSENWERRVKYAREWRRRDPMFGFRNAIIKARESGNNKEFGKLVAKCWDALVRTNGESDRM